MRFNKLDLNLLVALDALLTERNITRASERVHLSQSAMSNALGRLREYFGDELLVQVGRQMELTPRAEALQDQVRDLLVRIDATVASHPQFEPSKSDRTFRIFASDYTQFVLMPHLQSLAAEERFAGRFDFRAQVTNPQRDLERGEADFLIIPHGFVSPDHPSEVLFEDEFVCVLWRDSRIAKGELTFDKYAGGGHVVMKPAGSEADSFESWFVKRYGLERRVAAVTYAFSTLLPLVVGTENLATVHSRLAHVMLPAWPLVTRPVPIPITKMEQSVQWHKYRSNDPGLVWMRGLFQEAVVRMNATVPGPTSG